jgi:hypothetical protein
LDGQAVEFRSIVLLFQTVNQRSAGDRELPDVLNLLMGFQPVLFSGIYPPPSDGRDIQVGRKML